MTTYEIADDGSFSAPMEVAYPYSRTLGSTLSRFFTSLRDRRIEGNVGSDGRVYSPPAEFDPATGAALTEWVDVADSGTVTTWCWDPTQACGWALVQLDGADVPMMHRVCVESSDELSTGMRVTARWADETVGAIGDIECFVPEDA
jgi:uncharacterized protein